MKPFHPLRLDQIKVKNIICMQCGNQSCTMVESGYCPLLSGSQEKKEENHNERM